MKNNYQKVDYDSSTQLTSILNLKIFLFLSYKNGTCYFKELQDYLNRSKSQLSVALKKLKNIRLIKKNQGRPQKISITKKGIYVKNASLREIMKYRNYNNEKKTIKKSTNGNLKKNNKVPDRKPSEDRKQIKIEPKSKETYENFIKDVRRIVEKELIEYIGARIPLEILSDISLDIRNKIHDKLLEYF